MRLTLESDIRVIGEANNGAEAIVRAQLIHPDVIVMDVEMPGIDGIQAAEALRGLTPRIAVVVLSIHDDAPTRARAFAAGAKAFVGKHRADDTLIQAVRQAALPSRAC